MCVIWEEALLKEMSVLSVEEDAHRNASTLEYNPDQYSMALYSWLIQVSSHTFLHFLLFKPITIMKE